SASVWRILVVQNLCQMHATDGRTSRAGGVVARVQRAVAAGQHRRVWREPARRNGRMARRIEAENEAAFGAPLGPGAGRWGWYPPPALTRLIAGAPIPKQYCRIMGNRSRSRSATSTSS